GCSTQFQGTAGAVGAQETGFGSITDGRGRRSLIWCRLTGKSRRGDRLCLPLDFAFLAAESQPHDGEVRTLAFGFNRHDVLIVLGTSFQFHLLAAVVGVALELAPSDVALLAFPCGNVVVHLE